MSDAARGPLAAPGSPEPRPAAPVVAGTAYFVLVFAVGFALGTVRTLFVADAPGSGRLLGVLIELPVMLAASWFLCRLVLRRCSVPPTVRARLFMGATAFALLMLAEMLVGALLFGRSPSAHLALYRDVSYALGLAAQVAFAFMPLLLRNGAGPRGRSLA